MIESREDASDTEQLQEVKARLTPSPSPGPYISSKSASDSESEGSQTSPRPKKKQKKGPKPSPGDVVLLRHMDPNRPDVADIAGRHRLLSNSPSPTVSSEFEMGQEPRGPVAVATSAPAPIEVRDRSASDVVAMLYNRPSALATSNLQFPQNTLHPRSALTGASTWDVGDRDRRRSEGFEIRGFDMRKTHSWDPIKREYHGSLNHHAKRSHSPSEESASLATSPRLARHMINPEDGDRKASLPALALEAFGSSSTFGKALPPVGPLIEVADKTNDEHRNRSRASSHSVLSTTSTNFSPRRGSATFPLRSPNRILPTTPMSSVSEHSRNSSISGNSASTRASPAATPVRYTSAGATAGTSPRRSSDVISRPPERRDTGSSVASQRSLSASTSTECMDTTQRTTPTIRRESGDTTSSDQGPSSMLSMYPMAQNHVNGFKCEWEGCNAPAFATQYLLK